MICMGGFEGVRGISIEMLEGDDGGFEGVR